jgi:YesN/AraC family two-component response regulator
MQYLENYFTFYEITHKVIANISTFRKVLNRSARYLNELIKLATNRSAKGDIHAYIIEKANITLLHAMLSICALAYDLGLKYQQYFSKRFNSKIGMRSLEYFNSN